MTRNGKIARLPRHIRQELNTRLDDGEQGKDLVAWLNSLDEVQDILSGDFAGRPISEQNLSEWKQGGFLEWQRRQDASERLRDLVELSEDLQDASGEQTIANRLAAVLAAELATETRRLLAETTDPKERMRCICEALRQLNNLRKTDQAAARAAVEAERWTLECERREEEERAQVMRRAKAEVEAPIWDALKRKTMEPVFGGGEQATAIVDFLMEMDEKYKYPPSLVRDKHPANQTESNPIKPNSPPLPRFRAVPPSTTTLARELAACVELPAAAMGR